MSRAFGSDISGMFPILVVVARKVIPRYVFLGFQTTSTSLIMFKAEREELSSQ